MMIRELMYLLVVAGMGFNIASTASSGVLAPLQSEMSYKFGSIATRSASGTYQHGGWATLSESHDSLVIATGEKSLWNTVPPTNGGVYTMVGTDIFTGVALLTNLWLSAANLSGTFTGSFTATNPLGGGLLVNGVYIISRYTISSSIFFPGSSVIN